MNTITAEFLIEKFKMEKHPEGGYFKEVYRSEEHIKKSALNERFGGDRAYSTAIYFLLIGEDISKFHRIKSDEIWHFYEGSGLIVHVIDKIGNYTQLLIGDNPKDGYDYMITVKQGDWFAAEVIDKQSFAFVGCTVAPGFDFEDFQLAEKGVLLELYPDCKEIIEKLV